jgi:microsomal dipeptidase-like Zn-dependent dipeptidase
MQSKIEKQVMASVGIIYTGRKLLGATALKVYGLTTVGYVLVQLIWVHKIFENWAHVGLAGTWQFLTYAVFHTHLSVQIALGVFAVLGLSLLRDALRTLGHSQGLQMA